MRHSLYEADHDDFRSSVRAFCEKEVAPFHDDWERAGIVPRELWTTAGAQGLLGIGVDERYGGGGVRDFRWSCVLSEELVRIGASGVGFGLHNDVVGPYLQDLATEEQKQRWLPGFCTGELITAIAMTEPAAGSDLQGIGTTARRDGEHWVLNGSKTFITNGINADLVIVVARTDPDAPGSKGLSLLVVERDMAGFSRGRNLDKVGLKAQDTAELFFDDVRVPAANLLGTEGRGFAHLMQNLPQERLHIAVSAVAAAETVLALTVEYVTTRTAFGRPVGSFQNSRFVLAELQTEVTIARTFVDECVRQLDSGDLTATDAAMAKWWTTELQNKVADRCLQLHGGYGYMSEYRVSKAWRDARVQSIYGGTNEIMKEIVGRSMGL
ncbi:MULTISPECIES: acyl-CoA dehydrogenase family protein [unclassified Modestobacter]|uniref:acyl-CoA dehydrogenase family protein n=1 Tax=unclassified Modestobacter TaxID=2643866 RepID=UPI0022AA9D1D|nr:MULTISPECIES: acyl-CoA dehydrogenase family protein [unclassified Modestobacter]MCZ2821171.1 acyl-CoA dehydrogenase family protein [Modestobacter sp. VKM Ac-2977]MCZ2848982.1 acyl-CoA dehydrogenase family protein [Modestobacter sp. VKM Ac-2978]